MLPVNAPVELTIDKDKMKFKVNGKGYEMLVVSEAAASAPKPAAPAPAAKPRRPQGLKPSFIPFALRGAEAPLFHGAAWVWGAACVGLEFAPRR